MPRPARSTASGATVTGTSSPWHVSVSGEGTHAVHCSVSDKASNGQTANDTVKIDTVKPQISGSQSPAANGDGWNNTDVVVSFTCADSGSNQSGIATDTVVGATLTHEGRNQFVTNSGVCVDKAGNSADAKTVSGIKIDKTGPLAPTGHTDHSPDYSTGGTDWYKDSVVVSFTTNGDPDLEDLTAGSGVASVTGSQTFSSAGSFSKSGKATDRADNNSNNTVVSGNVDTQAPVVTLNCPTGTILLGASVSASWSASDPGTSTSASGVKSGFASGSIPLDTSTVGTHNAQVSAGASKDNVGHLSAASNACQYSISFNWKGFFQPIDNNPDQSGQLAYATVWNSAKAGQAIPVKFSLTGNQGLSIFFSTAYPKATQVTCPTAASSADPIETYAASNSGLQYDATADQYIYVWKTTSAIAGTCQQLNVKLTDGTSHYAWFKVTK